MRDLKDYEKVLNRLHTSADKQTYFLQYAHRHKEVISTLIPQSTEHTETAQER